MVKSIICDIFAEKNVMMDKLSVILLFFVALLSSCTPTNPMRLAPLTEAIADSSATTLRKEQKIDFLKKQLRESSDYSERLSLLSRIYNEYYIYQFDSATVYCNMAIQMAEKYGSVAERNEAMINKANLLTLGGYYNQASKLAEGIDTLNMSKQQLFDYYHVCYWIYAYWAEYCAGSEFHAPLNEQMLYYLQMAVKTADRSWPMYSYLQGELAYYQKRPSAECIRYYSEALKGVDIKERLYAQASYALARSCREAGNKQEYEKWIVRSVTSDQLCPLKENYALQELAMYLYQNYGDYRTATAYIYEAMKEARFYNNKLRMLEISQKLPVIVASYNDKLHRQQIFLMVAVGVVLVLVIIFLISLRLVRRRNRELQKIRLQMEKKNLDLKITNQELQQMYQKQSELDTQLQDANERLHETNRLREKNLRLFLDISALAMQRLENYKNLVTRKVKAHQEKDLLQKLTSDRISNEELHTFYVDFDNAFMKLYPTFVDEFIGLLSDDANVKAADDGQLTPTLRIFALIRLGVTESSEIASLLAYSPQTIYNYRSAIKNKAIHKDSFEADVAQLASH